MSNLNYEELYKSFKEENDNFKEYHEEICKEYESTLEVSTENIKKFEKMNKDYQNKIKKIETELKNLKLENEKLIIKNKDKLIDIQSLNEQNEKLNNLLKKYQEEKSIFNTKIVNLENDVDHYQNKIREYEDFIEELKSQLNNTIEDLITLQNEFETYKLNIGEELMRKEDEIKDIRSDINYKNNLIKKLSQFPKEKFDIKEIQQKLLKDKKANQRKRRFTVFENNYNKLYPPDVHIFEENNSYKNPNKINGNYDIKDKIFYSGFATPKEYRGKDNKNFSAFVNTETKIEKRKKEMNGLNTVITKSNNNNDLKKFEGLSICEEYNDFYIMNNISKIYSNLNDKRNEFEIELKNMMINIQKRKNILLNLKKQINEKKPKIEFRKK